MISMKERSLPYLKKRDILNNPQADAQKLKILGETYFSMDLLHDAFAFYEKAQDLSGVEVIFEKAFEEGDVFLVKQTCKILGKSLSREEWAKLGKIAEEQGKFFFALEAYREAGEEDEAGRLTITTSALLHEHPESLDMAEDGA